MYFSPHSRPRYRRGRGTRRSREMLPHWPGKPDLLTQMLSRQVLGYELDDLDESFREMVEACKG